MHVDTLIAEDEFEAQLRIGTSHVEGEAEEEEEEKCATTDENKAG